MSVEYFLHLQGGQIEQAKSALVSHSFARVAPVYGGIWIIPGIQNEYLARVFEVERGFLAEFDFFFETGERLRPWLNDLRSMGGFEIRDEDGNHVDTTEARFASWFKE